MIGTFLKSYLNDLDVESVYNQQGCATPHKSIKTIALLQGIFPSRLIFCFGSVDLMTSQIS